jgi:hypothetical protein
MSRWIQITGETLREAKIASLVEALSASALAEGQPERAAGIIGGVVAQVRRKIASCAGNRTDADETTIPASLRDLAVDLVIARLKNALEEPLTDAERDAVALAERELNRIAAGLDAIEQPDDAVEPEVEATSGTPSFSGRARRDMRAAQEGL